MCTQFCLEVSERQDLGTFENHFIPKIAAFPIHQKKSSLIFSQHTSIHKSHNRTSIIWQKNNKIKQKRFFQNSVS